MCWHVSQCYAFVPAALSLVHAESCTVRSCVGVMQDRSRMYTWGSVFYAIYFWVSFPVFFMMDEKPRKVWSAWEAVKDSLASGMAVTILLDLWRLAFTESKANTLPWFS